MIEYVILEAYRQPQGNLIRKKKIRRNQRLIVGRGQFSDLTFDDDVKMSGDHFLLEVDEDDCRVTDLKSTNGTTLNGDRIESSTVTGQDQIQAGQTIFRISIHRIGHGSETPPAPQPSPQPVPHRPTPEIDPLPAPPPNPRLVAGPFNWGSKPTNSADPSAAPAADPMHWQSEDRRQTTPSSAPRPLSGDAGREQGPADSSTGLRPDRDSPRTESPKPPTPFSPAEEFAMTLPSSELMRRRVRLRIDSKSAAANEKWLNADSSPRLVVGRGEAADWDVFDDLNISTLHFEMELTNEHLIIRDLNSENGTFLNDHQICEAEVTEVDRIRAGETEFVLEFFNE